MENPEQPNQTNQPDDRPPRRVNLFLITTIACSVLLVGAIGAFFWAYSQMNDYKDNSDTKVAAAIKTAKAEQKQADQKVFDEELKKPNQTFQGPPDFGSVTFDYPRTWSVYMAETGGGGDEVSVYFYPKTVPTVNKATPYALRVVINNKSYDDTLKSFDSKVKKGDLSATALTLAKTDSFAGYQGTRLDGQFEKTINGSVAVFKVRDKTLQLFTDNADFMNDYNNIILPSLRFNE
jgi:hypothetical protein